MSYQALTESGEVDGERWARLAMGAVVGIVVVTALFTAAAMVRSDPEPEPEDEGIDVALAPAPPSPEDAVDEVEPPPEPPPEPEPQPPTPEPPPPEEDVYPDEPEGGSAGPEAPETPLENTDAKPKLGDPSKLSGEDAFQNGAGTGGTGRGKGTGRGSGDGRGRPATPPPPPPPPPRIKRTAENTVKARRLSCPPPATQVDKVTVIQVRVKVDTSGRVVRVKAVGGSSSQNKAAEAAARGCQFKPAQDKATGQLISDLTVVTYKLVPQ